MSNQDGDLLTVECKKCNYQNVVKLLRVSNNMVGYVHHNQPQDPEIEKIKTDDEWISHELELIKEHTENLVNFSYNAGRQSVLKSEAWDKEVNDEMIKRFQVGFEAGREAGVKEERERVLEIINNKEKSRDRWAGFAVLEKASFGEGKEQERQRITGILEKMYDKKHKKGSCDPEEYNYFMGRNEALTEALKLIKGE